MSRAKNLDLAWQAMVDPTRRLIILALRNHPWLTAGQISEISLKSRPATSGHLAILIDAELLTVRRQGTRRRYAVNEKTAKAILADLDDVIGAVGDSHPMGHVP